MALSLVMWLLFRRGTTWLSAPDLWALIAAFWLVNVSFVLAIVSKLNLRLQEPSMTLAQMIWATLSTFLFAYFVSEGRHLLLMIYLLAMTFGSFRLDIAQHLLVAVTALGSYAVVIACSALRHPDAIDLPAELLNWVVFFVVLVGFSVVGGEANRLRAALVRGNRDLRQARDAAAIAFVAKSRFLASTSHELRTPLNVMLGATDIVDSAVLEPHQRDALSRARYASKHLLSLINTMIDLSRIDSGVLELRVQAMNLSDELDALQAMMESITLASGVELTLDKKELSPSAVMGDATRLQEVLLHLLKFAIGTSREVRLRARTQRDSETVSFSVSRVGVSTAQGMSNATATASTDPVHDSFSVDLCEKLIELMGGTLLKSSESNAPTPFEFELPMPQAPATTPVAVRAKTTARRKMLIVDDSVDNRMLLQAYLKDEPWDLHFAQDGLFAVAEAQDQCFDLILMDIRMPRMNGHDATRTIRQIELERPDRAPAKILAITADDSVNDRQRSLEAGCDEHVIKPLSKTTLKQILARI